MPKLLSLSKSLLSPMFLVFLTLSLAPQTRCQTIEPSYLSIPDGLASPTVNAIIQDSYGLIWIATANGLQKYDGYKFQTFKNKPDNPTSLQHNYVWSLLEDANHDIWMGTGRGVSKYSRQKNEFKNYDFARAFNFAQESEVMAFNFTKDSQNRLWVTTLDLQVLQYDSVADKWKRATYEVPGIEEPVHVGFSPALTEDRKGDLWLGSPSYGLMRQGRNENAFRPVPADRFNGFNFTEPEQTISALYADSTGTLWITSRTGVYKYNPEAGTFKIIKEYHELPLEPWNNWNAILPDGQGNIWIANNFRGILKFEGITDHCTEITIAGRSRMRGNGWNVTLTNFTIDRSGIFWFGTRELGLLKYDPVNKPFTYFSHDAANPKSISANGVYGIVASKRRPGIVYTGTRGSGINIFDPQKQTFEKVALEGDEDRFGGSARSIAEGDDGTLWVGTWGDGLIQLNKNYKEEKRFKYDPKALSSLSNNQVRVIKSDSKGQLWVGTSGGLNIYNPKNNVFHRVASTDTKRYPDEMVKAFEKIIHTEKEIGLIDKVTDIQDRSLKVEIKSAGTYWVMAVGEGDALAMADFGLIENADRDTVWTMGDYSRTFYAGGATKNRIIIEPITLQPGEYTLRYRSDDSHAFGKWNEAPPDQTALYGMALAQPENPTQFLSPQAEVRPEKSELIINGDNINDIEVTDKFVWVSAHLNGLNKIDPAANTVKYYQHDPQNPNSVSSNVIRDIYADSHGIIWLATNEGLDKFDPITETFTRYTESEGLPTNLTEGIVEGDQGEMWIATEGGLSQMVTNEKLGKVTFINYNSTDGLGGDTFLALAATRASDGRFYFGGDHGLTTFSSVASNKIPPAILITNVLISNQSVLEMTKDSPLNGSLLNAKSMTLSFDQNNLSFEFAALHYANPQRNQYAHMLQGYDKDWIYDNRNFAAYTNLDPGKYEFIVRASNAYGIWNEEGKSLEITILPPWWRTWWAYISYAVLFVFFAFTTDGAVRRRIKTRERERTRERELKQAREIEKAYTDLKATQSQLIQSEKMASLGELTAGIAHEIQNPLNFINNFSEVNSELIDELEQEVKKGNLAEITELTKNIKSNEQKINHHGKRADAIVKGMLQHSRSGNGQKEPTDINSLCDEYLRLSYHGLRAKDKSFNAKFVTDFDSSVGKINVISQDMGRVILNLINNAFYAVNDRSKRQQPGYEPTVTVATKKENGNVSISIKDNGNGIPKNVLDKIFQPFFTTKPTGQGTGLGLSLSYDIVRAHGGELRVETREEEGTRFTIRL